MLTSLKQSFALVRLKGSGGGYKEELIPEQCEKLLTTQENVFRRAPLLGGAFRSRHCILN